MSRTSAPRQTVLASPDKQAESVKPREGHRETVEAIVVAMILALLVRGFEAEAFVIPTGSMAPTLMGRHKEITCPQCGHLYPVNASEEVEGPGGRHLQNRRVYSSICVNCRFQTQVDDAPSFKGDRILVMKFPYDLPFLPGSSTLERWDVVVFRYPEEPEVSYIKRLVGLPGETLRIYFGDIYIKPPGGQEFQLARKPLRHQQAIAMMVYDDSHRAQLFRNRPEWRRWSPARSANGWTEVESDTEPGHFTIAAPAAKPEDQEAWAELRYRHLVPDPEQWYATAAGREPRPPRPTLITDFYSYNTNLWEENSNLLGDPRGSQEGAWLQPHWVGDLTLSARLKVNTATGSVRFELVEGGVANRCEIDLQSGKATLRHGDRLLAEQACPIAGNDPHDVTFANIDDRLTLLVDGTKVFGDGVTYDSLQPHPAPTAEDLSPVAVAARGAAIEVSDLVLKRDIYYTVRPSLTDFDQSLDELFEILGDPQRFPLLAKLRTRDDYPIGLDRYMMLGDNSPRSKDSRAWERLDRYDPSFPEGGGWDTSGRASWEVPRALITGKAFFVYWPHGRPVGPNISVKLPIVERVPFRPYFERMKWIR